MRDRNNYPIIGFGRLVSMSGMVDTEEVYEGMPCLIVTGVSEVDLCGGHFTFAAAGLVGKWGSLEDHYELDYVFPPDLQEPDVAILE